VNLGYRGPDKTQGVISTGISVPYSDEYRELRSNPTTLETVASLTDGQLVNWKTAPDGRIDMGRTTSGVDHFRRDPGLVNPRSFAALWPSLLWLAACLFLGDVAVRRIAPDTDRIKQAIRNEWRKLRGQDVQRSSEYLDKLKSRKAEVGEQLDRSRFATRFDPTAPAAAEARETSAAGAAVLQGSRPEDKPKPAKPAGTAAGAGLAPDAPRAEEASYTNRLLKAKKQVWEDREKEKEKGK